MSGNFKKYSAEDGYRRVVSRQSRSRDGELTFLNFEESRDIIKDMEVVNTETGQLIKLKDFFDSE